MQTRILIVAHDIGLRVHLARVLRSGGYRADLAESPEHARRIGLKGRAMALVALDRLGAAGDDLVAELQALTKTLLIAASGEPLGHNRGALDPSDENTLLVRVVDALRPAPQAKAVMLQFVDYKLDIAGHSLFRNGQEIPLTHGEFSLLREFLQRPGHVLARDYLLRTLSGREAEPYDRSIDMLVARLRRKIEPDPKRPTLISTVPGAGYKFSAGVQQTTIGIETDRLPVTDAPDASEQAESVGADRRVFSQADEFHFGVFRLNRRDGLSHRHGGESSQPITLAARALELLIVLVERHGELVTSQALLEAAWRGSGDEPVSLPTQIATLNLILNGRDTENDCIQTVDERGYRFTPAVTKLAARRPAAGAAPEVCSPNADIKPRLSVVVLPFSGVSSHADLDHYAEVIFADFVTQLSCFPGAFVVAGAKGGAESSASNVRQASMQFGVNYTIQGSILMSADRTSVNLQLIDTETSAHLWFERLDIDHADLNAHDEIIGRLARAVSLKLVADVNRRIEALPMQSWTAYDLVMRGRALALRPLSARNRHDALRCYQQALDMDPRSVWAKLGICLMLVGNLIDGGSLCVKQDQAHAEQLLLDVLRTDANIPEAHTYMGMLRRFQGRLDDSKAALKIAIGLVPNNILAASQLGLTLAHLGQPATAIPLLEWCLRLSPHDPTTPATYSRLGLCHLLLDHVIEAVDCLRNARALNPQLHYVHHLLAAALALRGNPGEATNALRQALEIRPEIGSRSAWDELLRQGSSKFLNLYRTTVYAGLLIAGFPDVAPNFVPMPDEGPESNFSAVGAATGGRWVRASC